MTIKHIAIIFGLLLAYIVYDNYQINQHNLYQNITIDDEPFQSSTDKDSFNIKDYKVTPLKKYKVTARVLSKKKYTSDESSEFSTYDLALGWNKMSDIVNIEKINITQRNRWYYWKIDNYFISREDIEHNSSNHHIIHANDEIYEKLKNIKEHQIVEMSGYLVKVEDTNSSANWVSSLTRTDTGGGACELMYVESLIIKE